MAGGFNRRNHNMSNLNKESFDIASLIKDIAERNEIILNYQKYGILDRCDAIQKIKNLRTKDSDIAKVTVEKLVISSTPFEKSTNEQLVDELAMQRDMLLAKLGENQFNLKL